jgi:hypothetical protein
MVETSQPSNQQAYSEKLRLVLTASEPAASFTADKVAASLKTHARRRSVWRLQLVTLLFMSLRPPLRRGRPGS